MSGVPPAVTPAGVTIRHNTYGQLVQDDDDLIGHVAYSLYKRDKLKFCDGLRQKHQRDPTLAEVEIFIQSSTLDSRLEGYRTQSETLLERMMEYQLEEAMDRIQAESDKELQRKLSEPKAWSRSIAEALLGSLVTAAMWGAIVLVLYTNKVGLDKVAKDIFNIDMNAAPQTAPKSSAPQ